jgi:hypothetical protein
MDESGGRRRFLKSVGALGALTFQALQAIKTRYLKRPGPLA